jgi:membrane protein YqaA with SNARE-associated domain
MNTVIAAAASLFGYAFLSNVALAVLPHEPAVIWYGARLGVWPTALVATAGTVVAAVVDHRLFVPLIERVAARHAGIPGLKPGLGTSASLRTHPGPSAPSEGADRPERVFRRWPFAVIALSGLTPLPFFPFKALAFATGYPIGRYAGAVAARSLPRYALLAWLGASVRLPVWLYAALFALLLVPSLRMIWWPRSTRTAS